MNRWLGVALRGAVAATALVLLWRFVRQVDWDDVRQVLAAANAGWIAAAVFCNYALLYTKAWAWTVLLAPRHPVPVWSVFRYGVISYGLNAFVPARAGEAMRVWLLKARYGIPAWETVRVALAEKLLDLAILLVLLTPFFWLADSLPGWVINTIRYAWLTVIALVVGLAVAWRCLPKAWAERWNPGHGHSLALPYSKRRLAAAIAILLGAWGVDLAMLLCVCQSTHVTVSPLDGLLVMSILNLAIAIPGTPGHVGTMDAGIVTGLTLVGVPQARCIAIALIYHLVQLLPMIAGMLVDLRLVVSTWSHVPQTRGPQKAQANLQPEPSRAELTSPASAARRP